MNMNYKALKAEVERLETENRWLHEHLDQMNAGAHRDLATFCEKLADVPTTTDEVQACLQMINSDAPSACQLEECRDIRTAVQTLVNFAWRAVNNRGTDQE